MPTEPLIRPISAADAFIEVEFDGRPLTVPGQCSVAAALSPQSAHAQIRRTACERRALHAL